ncbi:unnamed protein product [Sphenostylis stenocarpa]|uniref:HMA domain-containing protein n=1 Tax=Sphenostylis stenocarpa TaxID=92480 RepID=A0AA86SB66_9FABA|nr:unnamed protein product [Sphenostylis stenocarpa]
MAAKSPEAVVPSEPLKYQTWFLKVSIHCEGCRRKVKKVLQSIDGVFTTTVDPQQQKVTVTGSVGVETLIRKLVKAGKHAEIWPENLAVGKGKNSGKDKQQYQEKKKKKKNEQEEESESSKNHSSTTNAEPNSTTTNSSKKKVNQKSAEKRNAESKSTGGGENESAEAEKKGVQSEGGGKKKKKKEKERGESDDGVGSSACNGGGAHSGSPGQVNLSPTRQQPYLYPETYCYPPLVYLATHNNRFCPMGTMGGPSYYVSPLPYISAGIDHHHPYRLQSTPFLPFEIFSDENANGCSVM